MTEFSVQNKIHKAKTSAQEFVNYLHNNYSNGNYKCVYEAGFSGFHTQDRLKNIGVDTIIVHAAYAPTSDKKKRKKRKHNK